MKIKKYGVIASEEEQSELPECAWRVGCGGKTRSILKMCAVVHCGNLIMKVGL